MSSLPWFFVKLLFSNVASKLLLITFDVLTALYLSNEDFGAIAFLQSLILSGSIIAVWGADKAMVNIVGRTHDSGGNIAGYLHSVRKQITMLSVVLAFIIGVAAEFSNIGIAMHIVVMAAILVLPETQMRVNTAVLRAHAKPYAAVAYLDGIRNLALAMSGALLWVGEIDYQIVFWFWLCASSLAAILSHMAVARVIGPKTEISTETLSYVTTIARFSGMWNVSQFAVQRLILLLSAYALSPAQLGLIAFLLKLMIIFSFLQTVLVQAVAPQIGKMSLDGQRENARRLYATSTFFLAATITPTIGLCTLFIDSIEAAFGFDYTGPDWVLWFFFWAQAFNLGTGIAGQFLIHLGQARPLLFLTIPAGALQCGLLLALAPVFGVPGVLIAHTCANVLLVLGKNLLGAAKISIHGLTVPNLFLLGTLCAGAIALLETDSPSSLGNVLTIATYLAICIVGIGGAIWLSPDVRARLSRSRRAP